MPNKIIHVPHLGGIDAAYQMPLAYDPTKPTLLLINSFTTSSELFRSQFDDSNLTKKANLLAIEPLGHGQTRTSQKHWTYWDTAHMNLQVLDALGIDKAFLLGTSQGGWITVQMALLRPDMVSRIIPLGTSMDSESEHSRQLGCWDGPTIVSSFVDQWTNMASTPDFEPDNVSCDALIAVGFNGCSSADRDLWRSLIKSNYRGEEGRQRIRMAAINLAERGGLHLRFEGYPLPCALAARNQGCYSQLVLFDNGAHFLNWTHPFEVNKAVMDF
ncbi:hypothetical protein N7492_002488 [Penicillium capsulatum]|uniref:AB hydrolase-1 domain-containing protein n=1 Tax=Penicillium capsulatum TaxID=69766 RepID=A0A9W9IHP4_9EURO|nr:hypothetical protein N7492_002488 [Penicillium capsulatum]KAJ6122908.1 hypothetical protein N7512_005373 [Penicillium capsulatum]